MELKRHSNRPTPPYVDWRERWPVDFRAAAEQPPVPANAEDDPAELGFFRACAFAVLALLGVYAAAIVLALMLASHGEPVELDTIHDLGPAVDPADYPRLEMPVRADELEQPVNP